MSEKSKLTGCDWAAISLAAFFMSVILMPPLFRNIAQKECPETEDHVCEQVWQWVRKPSLTDWFLVSVGLSQLFVFAKQMVISRRQADIADRQLAVAASAASPILFVREFRREWLYRVDDRNLIDSWRFIPVFENTGHSLARQFVSRTNYATFVDVIPENYDFPDLEPQAELIPAHLGPGSKMEIGAFEVPVCVLVAAKKSMFNIFVWGWCEYTDVLSGPMIIHRVEFCTRIVVYGDPRDKDCRFEFPFYGRHNGEGDACYRKAGQKAPFRTAPPVALAITMDDLAEFGLAPIHSPPPAP